MSEDTFILGTYTKRSIMQCNATNKEEIGSNHAGPNTYNTNVWGIIFLCKKTDFLVKSQSEILMIHSLEKNALF